MTTTTRTIESNAARAANLLLAFELGERTWKLGFTTGFGQRPRIRQVPAGAGDRVLEEIARAKRRLKLAEATPVSSCYEAGRDGFWLHRYLVDDGGASSLERARGSHGLPPTWSGCSLRWRPSASRLRRADTELRMLAEADARMSRLMTVPGVGPTTSPPLRGGDRRHRAISNGCERAVVLTVQGACDRVGEPLGVKSLSAQ